MELLNYFSFPIQSNVYGLSCLRIDDGIDRLLVATLEKQIFCIEKQHNKFSSREVHFTYIPNGADIISIDAFRRSLNGHDFVVGITFVKTDKENTDINEDKEENHEKAIVEHYYFNIYASLVTLNDFDLDHIAQDCQTFEIEFVPYQLYHTNLYTDNTLCNKELVWILSGSDCCAHIFREDKEKQCFYEESVLTYFPELTELPSIALWIDVYNLETSDGVKRITAIGCENGIIQLSFVEFDSDHNKHVVTNSYKFEYDGPVLSVRLFTDQNELVLKTNQFKEKLRKSLNLKVETDSNVHLLVVNSIESTVVYRDVLKNGLSKRLVLPTSKRCDCSVTSCIADIDMDGNNEIAIGTYGHELIVYKYENTSDSYVLLWEKKFPHSLQAMAYIDLTGDGLKEFVVLTIKGLHVLQHDLQKAANLCHKRLQHVIKMLEMCKT